jgi:hypothetical protein
VQQTTGGWCVDDRRPPGIAGNDGERKGGHVLSAHGQNEWQGAHYAVTSGRQVHDTFPDRRPTHGGRRPEEHVELLRHAGTRIETLWALRHHRGDDVARASHGLGKLAVLSRGGFEQDLQHDDPGRRGGQAVEGSRVKRAWPDRHGTVRRHERLVTPLVDADDDSRGSLTGRASRK